MTPEQAVPILKQALVLHQRGQLAPAEEMYRKVLAALPGQFDALRYLGTLLHQKGENQQAIPMLKAAINAVPNHPQIASVYNNLGEAMRAMGGGGVEAAIPLYHKAIALQKNYPQARNNLASALATLGRTQEAIAELLGVLRENPSYFKGRLNLGNLYLIAGDYRAAKEQLLAALQIADRPKSPFASTSTAGAVPPVRPTELAAVHGGLGTCAYKTGDVASAVASFERAIALDPGNAAVHTNLGEAFRLSGRADAAETVLQKAVALDPKLADARGKLGQVRAMRGDHALAAADLRAATELAPREPVQLSNWLFELQYLSGMTPAQVLAEHRVWAERFEKPFRGSASAIQSPQPDRQLRVALVSGDFRAHPVAYFIEALAAHHDRRELTLCAYSDVQRTDAQTARLRSMFTEFNDIQQLSDEQLAQRLTSDRIDIAIDLAGHTGRNRLMTFARQPCPIQMTWLGYPCTTGLSSIQYRLTDKVADPDTFESHASEKLLRIDPCFLAYTPPVELVALDVGPLPAGVNGFVTFGSFNNIAKLSDATLALWAAVLAAVPGSRLKVKGTGLVEDSTRQRVAERMRASGIPVERVELMSPHAATAEHLRAYQGIDIALDTTPYNGTTTTCEALCMGVPVVTLAGDRHVGRVGASLLAAAGHGSWVASDADGYVRIAAALATDLTALGATRADLRRQVLASRLCDGPGHARAVTQALRGVWRSACAGLT